MVTTTALVLERARVIGNDKRKPMRTVQFSQRTYRIPGHRQATFVLLSLFPAFCSSQICPAIRIDRVSPAALTCIRETLPQHGILLELGNDGAVTGPRGAKGAFAWDSHGQSLSVTITTLPIFTACQRAASEILDFGTACTGTDVVTHVASDGPREAWRIDSPDVRKPETGYPAIALQPGDSVRVTGGGCAQTGGHGDTWRLYVDPHNDPSHHGTIKFPGQTSFTRLKNLQSTDTFMIPATASDLSLRLGYEDFDYSDNGYWGRDPGPKGECRSQSNAWVEIVVEHARRRKKEAGTNPRR